MPAPNATFELIELGKSQALAIFDNQRIGVGVVNAAFYDRRCDQHVNFLRLKLHHHIFNL